MPNAIANFEAPIGNPAWPLRVARSDDRVVRAPVAARNSLSHRLRCLTAARAAEQSQPLELGTVPALATHDERVYARIIGAYARVSSAGPRGQLFARPYPSTQSGRRRLSFPPRFGYSSRFSPHASRRSACRRGPFTLRTLYPRLDTDCPRAHALSKSPRADALAPPVCQWRGWL
jgi:hypothetical protein